MLASSFVIGLAVPVVVALGWAGVQSAWRRAFPEAGSDPDVLARRLDCRGCGCTAVCQRHAAATKQEIQP